MIELDAGPAYGPFNAAQRRNAHYHITGFRSLHDFAICLRPGFNVLLGPNGSGKTNFIDFLDFITMLVTKNSAAAISAAGGIARVFSQETLRRKIPRVTAKIIGLADLEPTIISTKDIKRRYFKFEYEVDIRYSKFHTAVYIANEKIKFKNLHNDENPWECESTVGSVEIHRNSPIEDEEARWTVGSYLNSSSYRNPLRYIHAHRLATRINRTLPAKDIRTQHLALKPTIAPDESILSGRLTFPAFDAVRIALSRGRSFNLNPQKARTPDDISKAPMIEPDGSGLSATLYQMQQAKRSNNRPTIGRRRFSKDTLETIVSWTQIVIPDLTDITITADPHTGKYLVYLHVGPYEMSLKIPLQSTSDGTLKWLTFVCLAASRGTEYTFEEPENFLHPMMQQFFISLLRESILENSLNGRFILSTHSETIINQCKPDELILFEFSEGRTICKHIDNIEALLEQVNETGFGLGYYYSQNVLH